MELLSLIRVVVETGPETSVATLAAADPCRQTPESAAGLEATAITRQARRTHLATNPVDNRIRRQPWVDRLSSAIASISVALHLWGMGGSVLLRQIWHHFHPALTLAANPARIVPDQEGGPCLERRVGASHTFSHSPLRKSAYSLRSMASEASAKVRSTTCSWGHFRGETLFKRKKTRAVSKAIRLLPSAKTWPRANASA